MSHKPDTTIRHGTANVFADLGLPNAETNLIKAELMSRVQDALDEKRLSLAAEIAGVAEPGLP